MRRKGILIVLTAQILLAAQVGAQILLDSVVQINRIERHEFISIGNEEGELKEGNYVAVATTFTQVDAKKLVAEYKKMKVPKPIYGYVSQKSLWYICFSTGDDIEEAMQKRDELRNHRIFKDAWLVTIHGEEKIKEEVMRHEFVARHGSNDMPLGDYVIVGLFTSEKNAGHLTDELKKLEFPEISFGYLSNKNKWYVFAGPYQDIEQAKDGRAKFRQQKMFKDAWLLTVHQ